MKRVDLYHLGPSHYCEKARKLLDYKRIPFRLVNVPYGDHSAVIKVSGQDYVPYVHLGGKRGIRWPDIADWAEKVRPKPTLYPGPEARARSRVIEDWAHSAVEEMTWRYCLADVPAKLKDPLERWVFIEMQERKRGPLEVMEARKKEFLGGVRKVCGLAEDLLDGHPYLLGGEPSLADFALYGGLHPLKFSGNAIPREFGRLRAWHRRVGAL